MKNITNQYDIIFVGNYTKDTIITPEGIKYVDGGGMNYAAHAGNQLGIRAAVVTRLAKEDVHVVQNIEADGIDCYPIYSPYSTLMTLEYTTYDVDKRNLYVKHVADPILPEHLSGINSRAIAVSPSIRGEVEPRFFEELRKRKGVLLAVDVQGFVRVLQGENLVYKKWDEMDSVLKNLDILKSDAVEAKFLTGESDIEKAAAFYANRGVKEIVLTHATGVLIHADGQNHHYEFHSNSMAGRSGRGDTCMGSYVSMRLSLSPYEAGKWAAAVTSMKVEKHGVFDQSIDAVQDFIDRYYA
jgi:sugar/nucleoside kinase (ribokinase family)